MYLHDQVVCGELEKTKIENRRTRGGQDVAKTTITHIDEAWPVWAISKTPLNTDTHRLIQMTTAWQTPGSETAGLMEDEAVEQTVSVYVRPVRWGLRTSTHHYLPKASSPWSPLSQL